MIRFFTKLLGLAATTAFWPGIVDAAFAPKWAALAVGIPVLLLCLLPVRHQLSPLRGWGLAFLIVAMASLFWAPDAWTGVDELIHLSILGMAVVLGATLPSLRDWWIGFGAGVSISAVLAIAQFFGFEGVAQAVPPAGLFMNKNFLAEAGMVALLAGMAHRLWWAIPGAVVALALTSSRAALGGAALGLALWVARARPRLGWSAAAALVSAGIYVTIFSNGPSAVERLGLWSAALDNLKLTGNGLGAFMINYPIAAYPHSEPLGALYELGILALPIAAIIFIALRGALNDDCTGERITLLSILAVSFFSFPFHLPETAVAAALLVGALGVGGLRIRRDEHAFAAAGDGYDGWHPAHSQRAARRDGSGSFVVSALAPYQTTADRDLRGAR